MTAPDMSVEIVDVTARDGLQNEDRFFSTAEKLSLIDRVLKTGVSRLEVASFAHPKYVPQMADAEDVIAALPARVDVTYIGLVMNERGAERALKTDIDELGFVASASDGFGLKNQNQTRQQSIDMACKLMEQTKAEKRVNVTLTTAFGCPFDGETKIDTVIESCRQLAEARPREIGIADTIGVANPWHVSELFSRLQAALPDMPLRAHFHNTRNTGLANVYAALGAGVQTIDVSIGGIGGCPFAPAATGNVPSEDVIYMLSRGGYDTGLSLEAIISASRWLAEVMDKELPAMVSKAGGFPK